MKWLVIQLPDPITVDDLEYEMDEPGDYEHGFVAGFNNALEAVEHRMAQ